MQSTTPYPTRPTRPTSTARPVATDPQSRVHDWAQASGRMLVSTFFIASAVSNMADSPFDIGTIGHMESSLLFNAVIYSMAFAVLVGRYMSVAALFLGLVVLWSGTLQLSSGEQELGAYWKDLAICGALFFMAASKTPAMAPALSRFMSRTKSVTPRRVQIDGRVMPETAGHMHPHATRNHVARPVAMPVFASRRGLEKSAKPASMTPPAGHRERHGGGFSLPAHKATSDA